jgi:G3E family GTPase
MHNENAIGAGRINDVDTTGVRQHMATLVPERIPVSIITGFLGSGKTTFLNRVLRDASLANSLVIINEVGEIGIDHLLVSTPSENLVLLDNGCLCCVLQGDLVQTFVDVYTKRERGEIPRFDRVIIETTGLADPVPVVQTIVTDPAIARVYHLAGVVTLVDSVHGDAQLVANPEAVKQIAVADVLLISKADLASQGAVSALRVKLAQVNPGAEVVTVAEAANPGRLLQRGVMAALPADGELERWLGVERYRHRGAPQRTGRTWQRQRTAGDRHANDVQTFSMYREGEIRSAALALWMSMLAGLRGRDLLRVKGLLNVEGKPVVIHVVQTIIHEPVTLEQWPDEDRRSRIVFIARHIEQQAIERTLDALTFVEPVKSVSLSIDPAAYAEFVRATKTFLP